MSREPTPPGGIGGGAAGGLLARAAWLGDLVIAAATLAVHAFAVFRPLGGDDIYVVENLASASWSHRLFAFDVDVPNADFTPWWAGVAFQRRFLRIPSSGLLWLQWQLFGRHAFPYHLVTAALLVASLVLVHRLARRCLPAGSALAVALVPAVHPACAEIVGNLNCQPLATAGLGCVATAVLWERMRRTGSRAALAAALASCALAMISYEAAIALPFALLFVDVIVSKQAPPAKAALGPRLALVALFVAYVPFAQAIRRGLTAPDTGPVRALDEVWRSARFDAVAYCLKAFGVFDSDNPDVYWLHQTLGEAVAVAVAVALLGGVMVLVRARRAAWVGLAIFAAFLLPPWLSRVTVALLNRPTLRQLYLPVLLGGPLIVSAWLSGSRPALRWAAIGAWAIALTAQTLSWTADTCARLRALSSAIDAALAGVPEGDTVIGVGGDLCGDSPSLTRSGGASFAVPPSVDGDPAALFAVDDHTLVAVARVAFDIPAEELWPSRGAAIDRGPAWTVRRPPRLLQEGSQRIPGATVSLAERGPIGVHALRYEFDRPLSELAFLRLRGCDPPVRMILHPRGGDVGRGAR